MTLNRGLLIIALTILWYGGFVWVVQEWLPTIEMIKIPLILFSVWVVAHGIKRLYSYFLNA